MPRINVSARLGRRSTCKDATLLALLAKAPLLALLAKAPLLALLAKAPLLALLAVARLAKMLAKTRESLLARQDNACKDKGGALLG
jgi:hypothetical protein